MKILKFGELNEDYQSASKVADIKYICEEQIKHLNEQILSKPHYKEIHQARIDAFQMILDFIEG